MADDTCSILHRELLRLYSCCVISYFYFLPCISLRTYFSVQLITIICTVVKLKCSIEKGNVCAKKSRDSGENDDLCAEFPGFVQL